MCAPVCKDVLQSCCSWFRDIAVQGTVVFTGFTTTKNWKNKQERRSFKLSSYNEGGGIMLNCATGRAASVNEPDRTGADMRDSPQEGSSSSPGIKPRIFLLQQKPDDSHVSIKMTTSDKMN